MNGSSIKLWLLFPCVLLALAMAACSSTESSQARAAALEYMSLRTPVEHPVFNSLAITRIESFQKGSIVIFSYELGTGTEPGHPGDRVMVLIRLDQSGKRIGGGAIGDIVFLKGDPVQIAWTWLGTPEQEMYAYYGPVSDSRIAAVELVEFDGSTSRVDTRGKRVFFLPRVYPGPFRSAFETHRPPQALRAFDASGLLVYEKRFSSPGSPNAS